MPTSQAYFSSYIISSCFLLPLLFLSTFVFLFPFFFFFFLPSSALNSSSLSLSHLYRTQAIGCNKQQEKSGTGNAITRHSRLNKNITIMAILDYSKDASKSITIRFHTQEHGPEGQPLYYHTPEEPAGECLCSWLQRQHLSVANLFFNFVNYWLLDLPKT